MTILIPVFVASILQTIGWRRKEIVTTGLPASADPMDFSLLATPKSTYFSAVRSLSASLAQW